MSEPLKVYLIEKLNKGGKSLEPREFIISPNYSTTVTPFVSGCISARSTDPIPMANLKHAEVYHNIEQSRTCIVTLTEQPASTAALREALEGAKKTTRAWYGESVAGWDLYQNSPEMKRINKALTACKTEGE